MLAGLRLQALVALLARQQHTRVGGAHQFVRSAGHQAQLARPLRRRRAVDVVDIVIFVVTVVAVVVLCGVVVVVEVTAGSDRVRWFCCVCGDAAAVR